MDELRLQVCDELWMVLHTSGAEAKNPQASCTSQTHSNYRKQWGEADATTMPVSLVLCHGSQDASSVAPKILEVQTEAADAVPVTSQTRAAQRMAASPSKMQVDLFDATTVCYGWMPVLGLRAGPRNAT